jgi:hypothetical protein
VNSRGIASPAPNALDASRNGRRAADGLVVGDEDDGMADMGLTSVEGPPDAEAAGGTLCEPGDTPPELALG